MTKIELDWDFWSKQKDAMNLASSNEVDITVFLGGYRSGKSVTGSRWIVREALRRPGSEWLAMAVDYTKGKHTTYKVLFEQGLPGENLNPYKGGDPENSPIVAHWAKIDRTLRLVSGSTITLAGADEETRYEGGSFNGVWMDEPGNYRENLDGVASTLLERMDAGAPGTHLWTTTGKRGQLQEIIEKRRWPDSGNQINNTIEVIRASTEENPFLSSDALRKLKRRYQDTDQEGMALHGEFGEVEGMVYPSFKREKHVQPREELEDMIDDQKKFAYGYDAGWDDERVVLVGGLTADGTIVILEEFYESQKFVEDACEWVDGKPKGVIHSEHEPAHIEKFNRLTNHKAVKAKKSIDAGIEAVRQRFQKQGLLVAEECENTIKELVEYRKEDVGGTNVSDHACDALRYLVMGVEAGNKNVEVQQVPNPFG